MTFQNAGDVAAQVVDRWRWWQEALQGRVGMMTTSPEQGFYRTRGPDGQWQPVAIWVDEGSGKWLAYRNGREVRDVEKLWEFARAHPIPHAVYEKAMSGGGFVDEPPAPIGHNSEGLDPVDALKQELDDERETLEPLLLKPVTTQAEADKIATWSKRIAEIGARADKARESEKKPHLEAGRLVDKKFRPVIEAADDLAKRAKRHLTDFMVAQKRAEEERARKAREDAERARRAADKAPDEGSRADALKAASDLAAAAEAKRASAGRTGARVSVREVKRAIVADIDALFAAAKTDPRMVNFFEQFAQRNYLDGTVLPGVEIVVEERVV